MYWSFLILPFHISELNPAIWVGVALVIGFHILLMRKKSRMLRKSKHEIKEREKASLEVLNQRNVFKNRTRNIEDSLKYAQRIQMAMFTTPRELKMLFPDSFIYQKAKDIVSGDFYWARQVNEKVLFSVADCTGHGVPGAFMSLIGLEFFRQIVVEKEILRPATILDEMNR